MKILITTDWYKPVINGVVTSVDNLTKGLENMGHEVRILTLSRNIHSYKHGKVTYIGSIGVGKIYPNARLRMALAKEYVKDLITWKPDIVHSQCEFSSFFIAKKIAMLCGAPLIHTYHTVYEDYTHYFSPNIRFGRFIVKTFSRKVLNKTQTVIAPTKKVHSMLENYHIKSPVVTVPSGLDIDRFTDKTLIEKGFAIRRETGIPESSKVLVYVGRLAKEKNIEELFCLLKDMKECDIRLLLVGDGPYKKQLKLLADEMNINDKIIFTGMVEPDKVAEYYKAGDVFVSASQSETQGLTYIEAMASGTPVLCRKDPCLDDLILQGINGFQYSSDSEFKSLLEKLLSDSELRKNIGKAASETIKSRYSSDGFAKSVFNVYYPEAEYDFGRCAVSGNFVRH